MDRVVSHNYSPCHRAIWAIFKINGCNIGICNIYAPNDYRDRAVLWDWLADSLPEVNWIVLGDFNMIDSS